MNRLLYGMVLSTVFLLSLASAAVMHGNSTAAYNSTSMYNSTAVSNLTSMSSSAAVYNSTETQNSTTALVSPNGNYTVNLWYNSTVGYYLTNATGFSLYMYTPDTPHSGNSTCYGGCAKVWPPFYTAKLNTAPGLNASNFGTITRTGGAKQTTYLGYPLYLYAYDAKAGQTNGQGVGHVWYLLSASGPIMPGAPVTPGNKTTAPTTNNTTGAGIAGNVQRSAVSQSNTTPPPTAPSSTSNLPIYAGIVIVIIIILAVVAYFMMHKK